MATLATTPPARDRRLEGPSSMVDPRFDDMLITVRAKADAPKRLVVLNEAGNQRIGEDHHLAKLIDAQVDAIRDQDEAYPVRDPMRLDYKKLVRAPVNCGRPNWWAGS